MYKKIVLSLLLLPLISIVPAYADDDDHEGHEAGAEAKEHKGSGHNDHDKKHMKNVFKEGTFNIISPFSYEADDCYVQFAHNYYLNSFPRGSNPYFNIGYTPINNLQFDLGIALRDSVELEGGIKYQIMNEFEGAPLTVASRLAYNTRGKIAGLDITAAKVFFDDVLEIGLDYRVFNYFDLSNTGVMNSDMSNMMGSGKTMPMSNSGLVQAIGANTIVRVWNNWSLFADGVVPLDSNLMSKGVTWSAGIKKRIDYSPHILSLYVGNTNESTISGKTLSTMNKYPDALKVGFDFSINIEHLSKLPKMLF